MTIISKEDLLKSLPCVDVNYRIDVFSEDDGWIDFERHLLNETKDKEHGRQ